MFSLSRNTIDLWLKRRETTGELQPKSGDQKGSRHKITNWEAFRDFAQEHGELTTAEMAQVWSEKVSRHTIRRGLKKIKFTRKKRHTAINKQMKSCATHSKMISDKKTRET